MEVLNFLLILQLSEAEDRKTKFVFNEQKDFSAKLSELRKNGKHPRPIVVIKDATTKSGNRWIDYNDYKKQKKEGAQLW